MDSPASLIWQLLFSAAGAGHFIYGKKQRATVPFVCGIVEHPCAGDHRCPAQRGSVAGPRTFGYSRACMPSFVDSWLIPIVSIFFIVDPLAAIPAFLTMTAGDPPGKRRAMALKASVASTVILVVFATAGGLILRLFGVTLPAFQIAGGIVLGLTALEMLRAERPSRERSEEIREGIEKTDISITPLAIPLLAGPGAISTVMVLMRPTSSWVSAVPVYVAIVLTGIATYVLLTYSALLQRVLGKTGIHVLSRLMGLVLATMAVQFVLDGLREGGYVRLQGGQNAVRTDRV